MKVTVYNLIARGQLSADPFQAGEAVKANFRVHSRRIACAAVN
jgi:hypothetical protein